jgi:hypothetical protein
VIVEAKDTTQAGMTQRSLAAHKVLRRSLTPNSKSVTEYTAAQRPARHTRLTVRRLLVVRRERPTPGQRSLRTPTTLTESLNPVAGRTVEHTRMR